MKKAPRILIKDNRGIPCAIGDKVYYLKNSKLKKGYIYNISRFRIQIGDEYSGWFSNFLKVGN